MVKNTHIRMGFMALAVALSAGMVSSCGQNTDPAPKPEKPAPGPEKGDSTDTETNTDDANTEDTNTDGQLPGCHEDKDCKADEVCNLNSCQLNEIAVCHQDSDCTSNRQEKDQGCVARIYCQGGTCHEELKAVDTACDDLNDCTSEDKCTAAGVCSGTEMTCTNPPADGCDNDNDKFILHGASGKCEIVEGSPTCVYTEASQDCQGNCAENCLAKCGGVTCEQDDSCYEVLCDATAEGTGTELCQPSIVKKAVGTTCKIPTNNQNGFCTENGACVPCLTHTDCGTGFECVYNFCQEKEPECVADVCSATDNKLHKCVDGEFTIETSCPYGCNNVGDNCAEPECTANVCEGGVFTACQFGKKQTPITCKTGCKSDKPECNPEISYTPCTKSSCENGKMRYCHFDNTVNDYILSEEIDCEGYQCDAAGEACSFYCTFQWMEENKQKPGTLDGYALTEINKYGTSNPITLTGGGLYCAEPVNDGSNLVLPHVVDWITDLSSKPTVNANSEIANKHEVKEWFASNSQVKDGHTYNCTFVATVDAKLSNGGTFQNLSYVCPVGDINETHQLGTGRVLDPGLVLEASTNDTRYIDILPNSLDVVLHD